MKKVLIKVKGFPIRLFHPTNSLVVSINLWLILLAKDFIVSPT